MPQERLTRTGLIKRLDEVKELLRDPVNDEQSALGADLHVALNYTTDDERSIMAPLTRVTEILTDLVTDLTVLDIDND